MKNEKLKSICEKFDTNKKIEQNLNEYYQEYDNIRNEMFYNAFPKMFGKHTFDFSINFGWFEELEEFCKNVQNISTSKKYIKIVQVKEKFGDIRIYFDFSCKDSKFIEEVMSFLRSTEEQCSTICETCGETGKKYTDGWHRIRCESHK